MRLLSLQGALIKDKGHDANKCDMERSSETFSSRQLEVAALVEWLQISDVVVKGGGDVSLISVHARQKHMPEDKVFFQ